MVSIWLKFASNKGRQTTSETVGWQKERAPNMEMSGIYSLRLPFVVSEVDALAEQVHELVEGGRCAVVGEDLLLGGLSEALVQQAELERVD